MTDIIDRSPYHKLSVIDTDSDYVIISANTRRNYSRIMPLDSIVARQERDRFRACRDILRHFVTRALNRFRYVLCGLYLDRFRLCSTVRGHE
jgi:hypothetical protein